MSERENRFWRENPKRCINIRISGKLKPREKLSISRTRTAISVSFQLSIAKDGENLIRESEFRAFVIKRTESSVVMWCNSEKCIKVCLRGRIHCRLMLSEWCNARAKINADYYSASWPRRDLISAERKISDRDCASVCKISAKPETCQEQTQKCHKWMKWLLAVAHCRYWVPVTWTLFEKQQRNLELIVNNNKAQVRTLSAASNGSCVIPWVSLTKVGGSLRLIPCWFAVNHCTMRWCG